MTDSNDASVADEVAARAKAAAQSERNTAKRDENQRHGVDDDNPAQNPETDR